jgi:hypothetical protein
MGHDTDEKIARFRQRIAKLDKDIEHAKDQTPHDPSKWAPMRLHLLRERQATLNALAILQGSRPLDESSEWRPSSGAFIGSNS